MIQKELMMLMLLWLKPKRSIKDEEYKEFYKFITYDQEDPFYGFTIKLRARMNIPIFYIYPQNPHLIFGIENHPRE
jgi:molecular chaperone HtpG